ncbi:LuxR family transcriptional regulator [Moorella naiadis]|uniref:LuxR C-terminal-related transcriptional regulator n=1 Tax=Moorella naiadis (nom. illeg.) TaxID=3093670 RepID=UPI003D9C897E
MGRGFMGAADLLTRLQRAQDVLAEKTGLSLVLVDNNGTEVTIPSRLPLDCFQAETAGNRCQEERRYLLKKAGQETGKEETVLHCCYQNVYSCCLKTAFKLGGKDLFLISGRTRDIAAIKRNLSIITAVYSLPVSISYPESEKVKDHDYRKITLQAEALQGLTRQEIRILYYVGLGLSNKDIAAKLFISPSTVKTHVTHILHKMVLANRTEAAIFALEKGLVKSDDLA